MINTKTDTGLLVEDTIYETALAHDQNLEYLDPENPFYFIDHQILLEPKQIQYTRTYAKLLDIAGNIGGLWNVLYYGLMILIAPIVQ